MARGEGHEGGVRHRFEHVHEVDLELLSEKSDGVLDQVVERQSDERPPAEVSQRRLAAGVRP